jgi:hypothetical protein
MATVDYLYVDGADEFKEALHPEDPDGGSVLCW